MVRAASPSLSAAPAARHRARRWRARRWRVWRSRWRETAWVAVLIWMCAPWETLLSGVDPGLPSSAQSGTSLYRYGHYLAGLVLMLVAIGRRGRVLRLARVGWPLVAFLAYAAAACAWSGDRTFAVQALPSYAASIAAALALTTARTPTALARTLALGLAWMALASVATVVLLPHYGVASGRDFVGASTPGDWRGVFLHKNVLGHVAGVGFAVLLLFGRRLVRPAALRWAGLAACAACLVGARSATGLVIAVALPLIHSSVLAPRGPARVALLGVALCAVAILYALRAEITAAALLALHRDADLSGRAGLWAAAASLAPQRWLLGWGFDYSTSPAVAARLTAAFGVNHVHSGYLDTFLNLGAAGSALLLLAIAGAGRAALRVGRGAGRSVGRPALAVLLVGWLLSATTEDMGVRPQGAMAELGLCALFGLYALRAAARSFRRPRFGFQGVWAAPLRPPRLSTPRPGRVG